MPEGAGPSRDRPGSRSARGNEPGPGPEPCGPGHGTKPVDRRGATRTVLDVRDTVLAGTAKRGTRLLSVAVLVLVGASCSSGARNATIEGTASPCTGPVVVPPDFADDHLSPRRHHREDRRAAAGGEAVCVSVPRTSRQVPPCERGRLHGRPLCRPWHCGSGQPGRRVPIANRSCVSVAAGSAAQGRSLRVNRKAPLSVLRSSVGGDVDAAEPARAAS